MKLPIRHTLRATRVHKDRRDDHSARDAEQEIQEALYEVGGPGVVVVGGDDSAAAIPGGKADAGPAPHD